MFEDIKGLYINRIGGVMIIMLALSAVNRGSEA
jgi:hypothetical protein